MLQMPYQEEEDLKAKDRTKENDASKCRPQI